MSKDAFPAQKGRGLRLAAGAMAIVALLAFAYLGTGLSTGVERYSTSDIVLVGVVFDVTLENHGLFSQTRDVHCEVTTTEGSFKAVKEVTVAAGETVHTTVTVSILGLNPNDIVEKKCYTSLL